MKSYGKELILDLHNCSIANFNRRGLKTYFHNLCKIINMQPERLCWWDDLYTPKEEKETEPHLVGTSAVQFIKTSNITIHTLTIFKRAYINIFSCKEFDAIKVCNFSQEYFNGDIVSYKVVPRC